MSFLSGSIRSANPANRRFSSANRSALVDTLFSSIVVFSFFVPDIAPLFCFLLGGLLVSGGLLLSVRPRFLCVKSLPMSGLDLTLLLFFGALLVLVLAGLCFGFPAVSTCVFVASLCVLLPPKSKSSNPN